MKDPQERTKNKLKKLVVTKTHHTKYCPKLSLTNILFQFVVFSLENNLHMLQEKYFAGHRMTLQHANKKLSFIVVGLFYLVKILQFSQ